MRPAKDSSLRQARPSPRFHSLRAAAHVCVLPPCGAASPMVPTVPSTRRTAPRSASRIRPRRSRRRRTPQGRSDAARRLPTAQRVALAPPQSAMLVLRRYPRGLQSRHFPAPAPGAGEALPSTLPAIARYARAMLRVPASWARDRAHAQADPRVPQRAPGAGSRSSALPIAAIGDGSGAGSPSRIRAIAAISSARVLPGASASTSSAAVRAATASPVASNASASACRGARNDASRRAASRHAAIASARRPNCQNTSPNPKNGSAARGSARLARRKHSIASIGRLSP